MCGTVYPGYFFKILTVSTINYLATARYRVSPVRYHNFSVIIIEPFLPCGILHSYLQWSSRLWHASQEVTPVKFNSLGPNDAIWRQRSGSTLAQVMACCLTAPSHYLNQCWLVISMVQWHSYEAISQEIPQPSTTKISLKITHLRITLNLPGIHEF